MATLAGTASDSGLTASPDAILSPTSRPRRRWLRPRFSLAAALAAVTLASVGLWYWYRLPFQIEQRGLKEFMALEYGSAPGFKGPIPTGQWCVRRLAWYRRSANSEPILHGERLSYHANDLLIGRDQWRDGVRHGLWDRWYSDGQLRERGAYYLGRKDGPWTTFRQDDRIFGKAPHYRYHSIRSNWRRGAPDGVWEYRDEQDQLVQRLEFRGGKLVGHDDLPITPRLAAAMAEPGQSDASFVEQLFQPVSAPALGDCRLQFAVGRLASSSAASGRPDVVAGPNRTALAAVGDWEMLITPKPEAAPNKLLNLRVNCDINNQPGLVALSQLLNQHNLVADYRFGMLWITTPKDAAGWRDTTGVAGLRPPRGSHLAEIWDKPNVGGGFVHTPITDLCLFFQDQYKVKIDLKASPNKQVTAPESHCTFAEILALTLDRAGCRCTLQGGTLVIEDLPAEPQ